ncbi:MAG: right-handed parallel beta-helix repeat-containing protein [Flavobacteriaceae bacterium]
MKNSITILLLFILFQFSANATVYYVSNTGNDSNLGTTINQAWLTINKVNSITFSPGDEILFNRGDTWNERLIIGDSGTDTQRIYYGAFGTGTKPTIDVQNNETSVIVSYHSYITIENLILKNSTNNALGFAVTGGCYGITVIGVEIFNAGNNALSISKGGSDILIQDVSVYNASNNGIYLNGSPANHLSNVIVENCYVSGTGANDGIVVHEDGNGGTAGSNFIIRNNYAELCAEQGFDITTGSNIHLYNNISKNNVQGGILIGHSANNITVERHTSIDEPTTNTSAAINIGGTVPNVVVKYSVIKGNGYHLLRVTGSNVEIYNNVFVYNGGGAIIDFGNDLENLTFKNNIVTTLMDGMGRIRFLGANRPANHPSFDFNNNIYYAPNGVTIYNASTTSNYTFSNFQTTFSQGANSLETDPLFIDRVNEDFHLTQNSPAIDAGIDLGLNQDFDGSVVPFGVNYDIGAFEYFDTAATSAQAFEQIHSIYPNPATKRLHLKSNIAIEKVWVIDVLGRKMNTKVIDSSIDVSHLNNGIYFLVFNNNNELIKNKFIVSH